MKYEILKIQDYYFLQLHGCIVYCYCDLRLSKIMYGCHFNYNNEKHIVCQICKHVTGNDYVICRNCWEILMNHKYAKNSVRHQSWCEQWKLVCEEKVCEACKNVCRFLPKPFKSVGIDYDEFPIYEKSVYALEKFASLEQWESDFFSFHRQSENVDSVKFNVPDSVASVEIQDLSFEIKSAPCKSKIKTKVAKVAKVTKVTKATKVERKLSAITEEIVQKSYIDITNNEENEEFIPGGIKNKKKKKSRSSILVEDE